MTSDSIPWKVLSSKVGVGVLTEGWNLAEPDSHGEDVRTFVVNVAFDSPFVSSPVVHLGLAGFDLDQRDSARLTLSAENITPFGFCVAISCWADSRVFAVEFNWLAIGA